MLTINLWVEQRSAIFVTIMSRYIPEFDKKISLGITFYASWGATRISVSSVLYRRNRKRLVSMWHAFSGHFHSIGRTKSCGSYFYSDCTANCLRRTNDGRTIENQMNKRSLPHTYQKIWSRNMVKLGVEYKESLCRNK